MRPPTVERTEKMLSAEIAKLAKDLGWHRYHTFRSDRSAPGFPDETLWRDRVLFLEVKGQSGRLSDHQKRVIRQLVKADAEVYVIRPDDLQDLANVLASRMDVYGHLKTASGRSSRATLNARLSAELG